MTDYYHALSTSKIHFTINYLLALCKTKQKKVRARIHIGYECFLARENNAREV